MFTARFDFDSKKIFFSIKNKRKKKNDKMQTNYNESHSFEVEKLSIHWFSFEEIRKGKKKRNEKKKNFFFLFFFSAWKAVLLALSPLLTRWHVLTFVCLTFQTQV